MKNAWRDEKIYRMFVFFSLFFCYGHVSDTSHSTPCGRSVSERRICVAV